MTNPAETRSPPKPSLFDKIIVAFQCACDIPDLEVAERLLRTAESLLVTGKSVKLRCGSKSLDQLVAAHQQFWVLSRIEDGNGSGATKLTTRPLIRT